MLKSYFKFLICILIAPGSEQKFYEETLEDNDYEIVDFYDQNTTVSD